MYLALSATGLKIIKNYTLRVLFLNTVKNIFVHVKNPYPTNPFKKIYVFIRHNPSDIFKNRLFSPILFS